MRLPRIPLAVWWEPAPDEPGARDFAGFKFAFRRRWYLLRHGIGNDNGTPWARTHLRSRSGGMGAFLG